jgi:hypothetical protein
MGESCDTDEALQPTSLLISNLFVVCCCCCMLFFILILESNARAIVQAKRSVHIYIYIHICMCADACRQIHEQSRIISLIYIVLAGWGGCYHISLQRVVNIQSVGHVVHIQRWQYHNSWVPCNSNLEKRKKKEKVRMWV